MTKAFRDMLGSLGICLITLLYLREAVKLPFGGAAAPSVGYVPTIAGVLLLSLSGYLFIKSILTMRANEASKSKQNSQGGQTNYIGVVIVIAALLLYPVALESIGFITPSILLTFAGLRVMQYRTPLVSGMAAILISVISYIVFSVWLGVSFPNELWN